MAENKGYIRSVDERGSINISEDVVAVIAAAASAEVEGVYGPFGAYGKDYPNVIGKKGPVRGVRLSIDDDKITIDITIITEIGFPVNEVGARVQKAVVSAVEGALGVTVSAVNINISGVALRKKEK